MTEPHIIKTYSQLIDYIRLRKNELNLSNSFVEEQGLMAPGYCSKIIGPSPIKNLSPRTLDDLMAILSFRLVAEPDPEQENKMKLVWEPRVQAQVRDTPGRLSRAVLEKARPLIFAELGKAGGLKRAASLTAKQRSEIASKAASARHRKARRMARAIAEAAGCSA